MSTSFPVRQCCHAWRALAKHRAARVVFFSRIRDGWNPPLAGQRSLVLPQLRLQSRYIRHAVDLAIAVRDLADVSVNADGMAVVRGAFRVDHAANRSVSARAFTLDDGPDRPAVRIRVAAPPASRKPAHFRYRQVAILDAHVVRGSEGRRLVSVLPLRISAVASEERSWPSRRAIGGASHYDMW